MPATATASHERATRRRCRSANRVMVIMLFTLGTGLAGRNAPREEPRPPPPGGRRSSCGATRKASRGRYPRSGMHASDTRSWTPGDGLVALAAFVLTLGLLAHGHGSTRAIDVPGAALAAVATLPLVYHRRSPLAVFALTAAASAAIN